jgi:hypothetical protein
MSLADALVDEVLSRPRTVVEQRVCPNPLIRCGKCWTCREADSRRLYLATDRYTDVTHGTKNATTVIDGSPPFRDEELARPWLGHIMAASPGRGMGGRRRRVPWQQKSLKLLDVLPPRFYSGDSSGGEWAYIDIVGAYPSIYTALTLDVEFRPHPDLPRLGLGAWEWIGAGELADVKQMHRAVGGILRARTMTVLEKGVPHEYDTTGWSPYLAPDLWGVIMFTLHAIAGRAVRDRGAILWDTDGGILPRVRAGALIDDVANWGLLASVREAGPGRVWGLKHWRIGDTETRQKGPKRQLRAENQVIEVSPAIEALLRKVRLSRL